VELIGLYLIASALLVLAGIAKALHPEDTARALVELAPRRVAPLVSLRTARAVLRVGATAEALLGLWALALPGPLPAALVACSYVLFTGVIVHARVHGGALSTCGCFGRPDTPATWLHAVLNALFAVAAVTVAYHASTDATIRTLLSGQPWAGVPLLFVCGLGLYLTYLALSPLAALQGARRLVRPPSAEAARA
jgi:hypothetical protein